MIEVASTPVELELTGMTCAACANRIERKLNKLPGVAATVNYATEKATVRLPVAVTVADAIAAVEAAGYGAQVPRLEEQQDDGAALLQRRLLVSTVLAVPVIVLSMVPVLQFPGWQWIALALALPVATWGAWPFHRAAFVNARHGAATMDTLVSLGVLAATGWSLYALLLGGAGAPGMHMQFRWVGTGGDAELYLEVAAAVTVFLLAGRTFEARAKVRSSAALQALLRLGAKTATVLRSGVETRILAADLRVGDRFVVRPGEKVATDGVVVNGASAVDTSLLTGEPVPVEVGPGDSVVGSALNAGGALTVEATRVGVDTELARIARLVEQAQTGKAAVQRLADRVSSVFVPVVIGLATATLAGWLIATGDAEAAFTAAVATLIIACPCALGLATPTALLVGTGRASQLGILIKGPEVLETSRRIDTALLDKTGTVTTGRMTVTAVRPVLGEDPDELLTLAAAAEAGSEHPIARAITEARPVALPVGGARRFVSAAGAGVEAEVGGRTVLVGREDWLRRERGVVLDPITQAGEGEDSRTTVHVAVDGSYCGSIVVADTVKPSSAQAIAELKALGIRPVLLTGDIEPVARRIAAEVGIDEVLAGIRPEGKLAAVRQLQAEGRVVAMIGDGVNDAAALTAADLGVAMGTGTDVAMEAADLTLLRADLLAAVDAIRLSRATLGTIKGNLFWAFAYNLAALPLAMAGLLNPLLAGAAMAASSVFVVTNSLRLRRFQPTPATPDHRRASVPFARPTQGGTTRIEWQQ